MKRIRNILSIVLCFAMLFSLTLVFNGLADPDEEWGTVNHVYHPSTPAETYTHTYDDVNSNAWYYDAVMTLTEGGLLAGYGNGKFGPNDALTRAQVDELSLLAAHIPDTVRQPCVLRLLERGRAMCLGGAFPDAEVVNVAGDSLRLSACVQGGRYTLVDMWASWCGACRAAIPMVKQLYAAYPRDRFEVISISFDSKKADWEEAMREEDMPWMQLWVGNERNYNALMRAYNVSSIPRLLLIDPSGNVIFSSYDADALKVVLEQALES